MNDDQGRYAHAKRILQSAQDFPERLCITATDVYGHKEEYVGRIECDVVAE